MAGVIGIIALLSVLTLSLVITRLASVALSMTGLSRESACFQARSAFTGTGFTTREAEKVVNHPVRRRIVMVLMILRSAGLVTVIISLILSFVGSGRQEDVLVRLSWLVGGAATVLVLAHLPVVDRGVERLIGWALKRWTDLDVSDYARLLKLSGDYTVMEAGVRQDDWLEGKTLSECNLDREGVTVLGIERGEGEYVGAPRPSYAVHAGDTLILYGRSDVLRELDQRRGGSAGDQAHQEAVGRQQHHLARQDAQERRHQRSRRESADSGSASEEQ